MRETPSRGVGSIQDQSVNYIQLNIQPPRPLLNTELRNATLNKDYEQDPRLWTETNSLLSRVRPAMAQAGEGQCDFGTRARARVGSWAPAALTLSLKPGLWASLGDMGPILPAKLSPLALSLRKPRQIQARSSGPQFPP